MCGFPGFTILSPSQSGPSSYLPCLSPPPGLDPSAYLFPLCKPHAFLASLQISASAKPSPRRTLLIAADAQQDSLHPRSSQPGPAWIPLQCARLVPSDTLVCVPSFGHALLLAGVVAEPSFTLGSPPVTFKQEIPCLAHPSSGLALPETMQLEHCLWRLHKKLVLFLWDQVLAKHLTQGAGSAASVHQVLSVICCCVTWRFKTTVLLFSGLKQ